MPSHHKCQRQLKSWFPTFQLHLETLAWWSRSRALRMFSSLKMQVCFTPPWKQLLLLCSSFTDGLEVLLLMNWSSWDLLFNALREDPEYSNLQSSKTKSKLYQHGSEMWNRFVTGTWAGVLGDLQAAADCWLRWSDSNTVRPSHFHPL